MTAAAYLLLCLCNSLSVIPFLSFYETFWHDVLLNPNRFTDKLLIDFSAPV